MGRQKDGASEGIRIIEKDFLMCVNVSKLFIYNTYLATIHRTAKQ